MNPSEPYLFDGSFELYPAPAISFFTEAADAGDPVFDNQGAGCDRVPSSQCVYSMHSHRSRSNMNAARQIQHSGTQYALCTGRHYLARLSPGLQSEHDASDSSSCRHHGQSTIHSAPSPSAKRGHDPSPTNCHFDEQQGVGADRRHAIDQARAGQNPQPQLTHPGPSPTPAAPAGHSTSYQSTYPTPGADQEDPSVDYESENDKHRRVDSNNQAPPPSTSIADMNTPVSAIQSAIPLWINNKERNSVHRERRSIPTSSDKWFTQQQQDALSQSMRILPYLPNGDRGLPQSATEQEDMEKRLFDAITDNSHFFGSVSSQVASLVQGKVQPIYIASRARDIVAKTIEYHQHGLIVPKYAKNEHTGFELTGTHKYSDEFNETFATRFQNILDATRYCKLVCTDFLLGRIDLTTFILAPKKSLRDKLKFEESNAIRTARANGNMNDVKKRKR